MIFPGSVHREKHLFSELAGILEKLSNISTIDKEADTEGAECVLLGRFDLFLADLLHYIGQDGKADDELDTAHEDLKKKRRQSSDRRAPEAAALTVGRDKLLAEL